MNRKKKKIISTEMFDEISCYLCYNEENQLQLLYLLISTFIRPLGCIRYGMMRRMPLNQCKKQNILPKLILSGKNSVHIKSVRITKNSAKK